MARKVKYQIRLVAFTRNTDGTRSVYDIIETDYHYAYSFAKRFMRDDAVSSFATFNPNGVAGREYVKALP